MGLECQIRSQGMNGSEAKTTVVGTGQSPPSATHLSGPALLVILPARDTGLLPAKNGSPVGFTQAPLLCFHVCLLVI